MCGRQRELPTGTLPSQHVEGDGSQDTSGCPLFLAGAEFSCPRFRLRFNALTHRPKGTAWLLARGTAEDKSTYSADHSLWLRQHLGTLVKDLGFHDAVPY